MIGRGYLETVKSFINQVEKTVESLGIEDKAEVKKYISEGNWKKRGGGEGVDTGKTRLDIIQKEEGLRFVLNDPGDRFEEWIKVLGPVRVASDNGKLEGDLLVSNRTLHFSVDINTAGRTIVDIDGIKGDKLLLGRLNKVAYKSTYCTHCGVCEVECPTGALSVIPSVLVNTSKCIHCYSCLDFVEKGCLRAKSVATLVSQKEGGNTMSTLSGFGNYLTFGFRSEWLKDFMVKENDWFSDNILGPKQVEAMLYWLRDAELVDSRKKTVTPFYEHLKGIFEKDELLAFELVWVNLFYNCAPVFWYLSRIPWGKAYSSNELKQMVENEGLSITKRTISSGIDALFNTFEANRYLQKLGVVSVVRQGRERVALKMGTNNVHPGAVLYALYRYALCKGYYNLTVKELYNESNSAYGGPYVIFGVERQDLERLLRGVQEQYKGLVSVDLVADLDNIHLDPSVKDYKELLSENVDI